MGIVYAQPIGEGDGGWSYPAEHRYGEVWQVFMADDLDTAFDLLNDSLCPRKLGQPYTALTYNPTTDGYGVGAVKDADARVVYLNPRRDPDHPKRWLLDVRFEGEADPLAAAVEVDDEPVTYQEQGVVDAHGLVYCNSALEPYEDGATVDRTRRRLTITRNIPYDAWDPDKAQDFENTKNLAAYVYGVDGKVVSAGPPAVLGPLGTLAPGAAKIFSLGATRMARGKSPFKSGATAETYYWRMRAVIDYSKATYVDNNGQRAPLRWQAVFQDAGPRYRDKDGRLVPFEALAGHTAGVGLLDGMGRRLILPSTFLNQWPTTTEMPVPTVAAGGADYPVPNHSYFATRKGTDLKVPAPGVLANGVRCVPATSVAIVDAAAHGTVNVLGFDGYLFYTPTAGYVGWDRFTFTVTTAAGTSAKASVFILVGPAPRVRVFERYLSADWSQIASWIGGW